MRENYVYNIPEQNLEKFLAEIKKLNKKAKRILGYDFEPVIFGYDMVEERGMAYKVYNISFDAPSFKINGWEFVGSLDHSQEHGNILRTIPGKTVPVEYRDRGCVCDHCSVNRFRRNTFIVVNEQGEYKQVGSACLKDFLGQNPEKTAEAAEILGWAAHHASQAQNLPGTIDYRFINTREYLAHVAMAARQHGYVSSATAKEKGIPSSGAVAWSTIAREQVSEKDVEQADTAIKMVLQLAESGKQLSDYEHNLTVVAKAEYVEPRSLNYVASMIGMLLREQAKSAKAQNQSSQHLGAVGDKITAHATVTLVRRIDGAMGPVTLYGLRDDQGNEIRWFSTSDVDMEKDQRVQISGRIKKLDVYNGIQQTILTRCKLL